MKLAETAKGTKFTLVHDSMEDLKQGKVTILPSVERIMQFPSVPDMGILSSLLITFGRLFADGTYNLEEEEGALNEIFPEIKPMKVRQALEAAAKAA